MIPSHYIIGHVEIEGCGTINLPKQQQEAPIMVKGVPWEIIDVIVITMAPSWEPLAISSILWMDDIKTMSNKVVTEILYEAELLIVVFSKRRLVFAQIL